MGDELKGVQHHGLHEILERLYAGDPEISGIVPYTGMKLVSTEREGRASITFQSDRRFANAADTLQGGVLATVADAALGLAFLCTLEETEAFTTLDLKINFLRPVRHGTQLRFEAVVVHRGKTTGLVNCDVTDADGKLMAQCSSTCMVLRRA